MKIASYALFAAAGLLSAFLIFILVVAALPPKQPDIVLPTPEPPVQVY